MFIMTNALYQQQAYYRDCEYMKRAKTSTDGVSAIYCKRHGCVKLFKRSDRVNVRSQKYRTTTPDRPFFYDAYTRGDKKSDSNDAQVFIELSRRTLISICGNVSFDENNFFSQLSSVARITLL